MHDYDVYEALFLNCEILDPWVRGSDPKVGQIWPCIENLPDTDQGL